MRESSPQHTCFCVIFYWRMCCKAKHVCSVLQNSGEIEMGAGCKKALLCIILYFEMSIKYDKTYKME